MTPYGMLPYEYMIYTNNTWAQGERGGHLVVWVVAVPEARGGVLQEGDDIGLVFLTGAVQRSAAIVFSVCEVGTVVVKYLHGT